MPYRLAPNIELLYVEAGDPADRVRAAADDGFDAVEMWGTPGKDLDAMHRALDERGVSLESLLAQPFSDFTPPWADLGPFWDGLERDLRAAQELGCPRVVISSGIGFPGQKRTPQLERLAGIFGQAAAKAEAAGVTLVLEPVNSRVDHPGVLTDRTADAVTVARQIGSPAFGILYDLYHSIVMGEEPESELAAAGDTVRYVQLADVPGRGEPGTGDVDWDAQLAVLRAAGYDGPIGLEFFPTVPTTQAVSRIRAAAAGA